MVLIVSNLSPKAELRTGSLNHPKSRFLLSSGRIGEGGGVVVKTIGPALLIILSSTVLNALTVLAAFIDGKKRFPLSAHAGGYEDHFIFFAGK